MIDLRDAANDEPTLHIDLISAGGKGYSSNFKIGKVARDHQVVVIHCTQIEPGSTYRSAVLRIPRRSIMALVAQGIMRLQDLDAEIEVPDQS